MKELFFEKRNENGEMNLQTARKNNSKSQKLKFVMRSVSSC
jgi:hypothetical protein